MDPRLNMIPRSETRLSEEALAALEKPLKDLAAYCARYRQQTDRVALVCISALAARHIDHDGVQSFLCYLLGRPVWAELRENLPGARYGAQFLLQEMADRGLLNPGLAAEALACLEPADTGDRAALAAFLRRYGGGPAKKRPRALPLPPTAPGSRVVVGAPFTGGFGADGRSGSGFASGFGSYFGSGGRSGLGSRFGSGGRSGFGSAAGSRAYADAGDAEDCGGYGLELIERSPLTEEAWMLRLLSGLRSPGQG